VWDSDSVHKACFENVTPPVDCAPDCRGGLYSWMAAAGNGTVSSPYVPNPVVPYDSSWVSTPAEPEDLNYTYTWSKAPDANLPDPNLNKMNDGVYGPYFNPQNPQDFNGKWVAFGGSSEPVEIRINLGSSKAVGEIQFNFWLKI